MKSSVYVTPAAQADFRAAFQWYESKRHGLGREFVDEIDTLIQQITDSPKSRSRETLSLCRLLSA